MKRIGNWLPHPLLTPVLVLIWLLLNNSFAPGQILLGLLLGWAIPRFTLGFWPQRVRIRRPVQVLRFAGVFLHDVGKTAELSYQRSFGYTDAGNLLGHIALEADWISRAVGKIPGFPEELRMQILHIVLSHHGRLEFGSPVLPKTPEALLVHYLDDLDGKLEVMFGFEQVRSCLTGSGQKRIMRPGLLGRTRWANPGGKCW